MTGMIEAAGDVATGTGWSRTAEPTAGEHPGGAAAGACLNCGTTLGGRYCHACGQSSHVHRTLMSIVHDLLHGVFHFEGKIWRTVPMLVLHPGQWTRRYIAGERARLVSPLALFLFTMFLMSAAYNSLAASSVVSGITDGWNSAPTGCKSSGPIAALSLPSWSASARLWSRAASRRRGSTVPSRRSDRIWRR